MLKKNPLVTFGLCAVSTLLPLSLAAQQIDRTVLPVPDPQPPTITELDVRNVKPPPRFEVKAPANAPNVVVVLLDDIGFGQSSALADHVKCLRRTNWRPRAFAITAFALLPFVRLPALHH